MPTTTSNVCPLNLRRWQSATIIAVVATLAMWSLIQLLIPSSVQSASIPQGGKDLEAYRRIVARVHQGEGYYSVVGDELRQGSYFSSSVFNWRLPTYAWLLGAFPRPEWGQALLCLLALIALALAFQSECKQSNIGRAVIVVLLMLGAFLWCIDGDAFFAQELWAGVLIAMSVCAFANNQRGLGICAGLAALFLRELALPYVLISLILACREKRWREVTSWLTGLAVFAAFFVWHAWQVQRHLTGTELVDHDGWIQFGGPAFVVQTIKMNFWLFNLPSWIALLFLIAVLLGLASWRGPTALRVGATVIIYMFAFLVVGKPFNAYWGLLYVPLLPFALVRMPAALRRHTELPASQPVLQAAWKL